MRIWDIPPENLCRQHLLGEHSELHGLWSVLTKGKSVYTGHPETKRWRGKLKGLYLRHEQLVQEMKRRGYNHASPLETELATGLDRQDEFVDTIEQQVAILRGKRCGCSV